MTMSNSLQHKSYKTRDSIQIPTKRVCISRSDAHTLVLWRLSICGVETVLSIPGNPGHDAVSWAIECNLAVSSQGGSSSSPRPCKLCSGRWCFGNCASWSHSTSCQGLRVLTCSPPSLSSRSLNRSCPDRRPRPSHTQMIRCYIRFGAPSVQPAPPAPQTVVRPQRFPSWASPLGCTDYSWDRLSVLHGSGDQTAIHDECGCKIRHRRWLLTRAFFSIALWAMFVAV